MFSKCKLIICLLEVNMSTQVDASTNVCHKLSTSAWVPSLLLGWVLFGSWLTPSILQEIGPLSWNWLK